MSTLTAEQQNMVNQATQSHASVEKLVKNVLYGLVNTPIWPSVKAHLSILEKGFSDKQVDFFYENKEEQIEELLQGLHNRAGKLEDAEIEEIRNLIKVMKLKPQDRDSSVEPIDESKFSQSSAGP